MLTDAVVSHCNWKLPEYSVPYAAIVKALQMLARIETILLSAVCTRKIMAALTGLARQALFKQDGNMLFIHTGSAQSLRAQEVEVRGMVDVPGWLLARFWLNAPPATSPVQPQSLTA